MNQSNSFGNMNQGPQYTQGLPWYVYVIRTLIAAVIIGCAVLVSFYWMTHRPQAMRQRPVAIAQLVQVSALEKGACDIVVEAMGTVVPSQSVQLAAQVQGKVVSIAPQFVPGGYFKAGETILNLEPDDYRLIVAQRTSELVKAQADLKLEMGQQSIAEKEFELLRQDVLEEDKELLLRKPQLATAEAAVTSAKASLDHARLNLDRTTVASPFNAMVQSRNIDLGSLATTGMSLASLIGTNEYWIQVLVPVDQLDRIDIPGTGSLSGSKVRVYCDSAWEPEAYRTGTVLRLMPDLESEGRMAQLLVSVRDPLGLKEKDSASMPLILNSYVRVEIEGQPLQGAICIPRTSLRDGNRVWIMRSDHTLEIREVAIAWSGGDSVYVTEGLQDGDMIITSDLPAPVAGMALRTSDMPATTPSENQGEEVSSASRTEVNP